MTWVWRLLRFLKWTFLGATGVLVIGYFILVLVNWRDQPPSPDTQRFERFYRELPSIADDDNAYPFVLGFTTGRDADPAAAGAKRLAWLQQQMRTPHTDWVGDPLGDSTTFLVDRNESLELLAARCRQPDTGCLLALADDHDTLADWLRTEDWLAQRYRKLIAYGTWRELTPVDVMGPLPAWHHVLHGQQVFLAEALVQAWEGNVDEARTALEADIRFWLRVLEHADNLITRSVATRALARNLLWTNLASRQLKPDDMQRVLPQPWASPLSLQQCSMRRVFAGEWKFGDFLVKNRVSEPWVLDPSLIETNPGWLQNLLLVLKRPLLQPQDTSNRDAAVLAALGETLHVPCEHMKSAIDTARRQEAAARSAVKRYHPYNLAYNLVSTSPQTAHYDFAGYAGRVADIETMRRGLLLTIKLRRRGITLAQVGQELKAQPLANPVNSKTFAWNPEHGTVTFTGLATNQQELYSIPY